MNRNFWLTLFVSTCLVSCSQQKVENGYTLKPSDDLLRIELDSLTPNISSWLGYYYDPKQDSGLLFSVDPVRNEIERYSLQDGKLFDKMTYDREGPKGVGTLIEIGILGLDSVLIFPPFDNSFYQSRFSDAALNKVAYNKPDEYSPIRSMTNYFSSPAYTDGQYIYTKTLFGGNYMLMENEELSEKPLMYRVNVASGAVEFAHFTFPDDYWADGKTSYEFSTAANDGQFAFSFYGDHNIYVANSFDEELRPIIAKSNYLPADFECLPEAGSREDRLRYFATTQHYGSLIYDTYRNVYYRFCYPKVDLNGSEDVMSLVQFPPAFSIMILDSEFKVLGEKLIEKESQLAPGNVFVGSKGLYISINHPDHPDNLEDYFSFTLFELVEE
ncbi:DUF4221 family protein [Roseivirga pacifica]